MLINFKNVTYKIPNGQTIYRNLNLKVYEDEFYGVLGKNGAGKSTLIEMIMGMRVLAEGSIDVLGENPASSVRGNKKDIFVVSHDIQIPSNISVREMLDFYKFFYPNYDQKIEADLFSLFDIDPRKKFGALSTGQKVKGILCGAFAARTKLYLFDEVTAVLDPKSRRSFFNYLKEFRRAHSCSLLMATNIAEDLAQSVDKVLFIDDDHKVKITGVENLERLFFKEEVA